MIKALIFELDNCLAAANEVGDELYEPAFEAIRQANSADSEIAAGNRLGVTTVQTLRPGVPRANNATFYIASLAELKELLSHLQNGINRPIRS